MEFRGKKPILKCLQLKIIFMLQWLFWTSLDLFQGVAAGAKTQRSSAGADH